MPNRENGLVSQEWRAQEIHAVDLIRFATFFSSRSSTQETLGSQHRNLRAGTSVLAQVLQIFFGTEHLVNNWPISTLDKVIYYKGTFLQG
jgi:hypothetical protein